MKKFLCYAIGAVSSLCLLSCQKDDMKDGLFLQGTLLGNFIFLPFAGRVGGDNPEEIGESGYYWTTESLGAYPYALVVRISGTTSCMNAYPVKGYTVRAVCD